MFVLLMNYIDPSYKDDPEYRSIIEESNKWSCICLFIMLIIIGTFSWYKYRRVKM